MELKMVNDKGAAGTFNAPDALFARDFNEALVHQIVVAFQANARLGTRAQKDRGAVDDFRVAQPKTKLLAQKVRSMGFDGVLVITDEIDQNLRLSSRNLPNVEVIAVRHANPVALVRFPSVLLTKAALAKLEEM